MPQDTGYQPPFDGIAWEDYELPWGEVDWQDGTIWARFLAFHEANPIVYQLLKRLAFERLRRGDTRGGIGALFESLRWDREIVTRYGEGFKLSNDFRSRYVRLLIAECPELRAFFELRPLRTP